MVQVVVEVTNVVDVDVVKVTVSVVKKNRGSAEFETFTAGDLC